MPSNLDIYRSAAVMLREHGDNAALEAGMRADSLLDKGDVDGQRTWLRIVNAIEELQKTTLDRSDVVH